MTSSKVHDKNNENEESKLQEDIKASKPMNLNESYENSRQNNKKLNQVCAINIESEHETTFDKQ